MDIPVRLSVAEASDSWGFVGVACVGTQEIYRTVQSYDSPTEAEDALVGLFGRWLGEVLAGREWADARDALGAIPTRADLRVGRLRGTPSAS